MQGDGTRTQRGMSFCLRFLKRKQVSSPILLRSLVNASIWIFAGFLAAFGRLYSLPLELQAEIATPILVVASAMFLTFIFSVVRRKSKLQRDIESCDEFIDFVIDEAVKSGICCKISLNRLMTYGLRTARHREDIAERVG